MAKMGVAPLLSFLLVVLFAAGTKALVIDVLKHGAKADGTTDNSAVFEEAWKEVCAATDRSELIIPKGEYLVNTLTFMGPCKAPVIIGLQGTLKAPKDPSKMNAKQGWVTFQNIQGLTVKGGGVFDGMGAHAWHLNDCKTGSCAALPNSIGLFRVLDSKFKDITSKDSKLFHMNVIDCKNLTMENLRIEAPEESPNTDGIHIGRSKGINITGAVIRTGDDCISFGDGSVDIHIRNIVCGPGHGISIGSLGKYKKEKAVRGIYIKNCTITGTNNGVRIKTWPGSPHGIATQMHFDDIRVNNVTFPILIDQEYCPWKKCDPQGNPSKVKISDVSFTNIRGTSSREETVKLMCSKSFPCQRIMLKNIDITFPGGKATSTCDNIKPIIKGKVVPAACGGGDATPAQGMPDPLAGDMPDIDTFGAPGNPVAVDALYRDNPEAIGGGAV